MTNYTLPLDDVARKLNVGDIADIYKIGTKLVVKTADGKAHKLDLSQALDKLGIDLNGRQLVAVSIFGDLLTFDTRTAHNVTIYDLAKAAVEERRNCFTDETVTIWQGKRFRVRLYRWQMRVMMDALNSNPRQCERVIVGYYSPRQGWTFALSQADYKEWVTRAKKAARVR